MKNNAILRAVITGVIVIFLLSLLLSAVAAWMIHAGVLPLSGIHVISYIISIASSFAGSVVCAKKAVAKRLPLCIGCGLIYLLIIFILRGLIFGDTAQQLWLLPIFTLLSCLLGAILGSGKKRRKY